MVVHDLDVLNAIDPAKANAPLVVDANAVLTLAVTFQGLEPVAWRGLLKCSSRSADASISSLRRAIRSMALNRLTGSSLAKADLGGRSRFCRAASSCGYSHQSARNKATRVRTDYQAVELPFRRDLPGSRVQGVHIYTCAVMPYIPIIAPGPSDDQGLQIEGIEKVLDQG